MRMWLVDPRLLCRKHLLGAHLETHYAAGFARNGRNLRPWTDRGFLATEHLQAEHDRLAAEMVTRGYRHQSELAYWDTLRLGVVDVDANLRELVDRCAECGQRIGGEGAWERSA